MGKFLSKLGVKTLVSSAISLGGGGVFNAPLNNEKLGSNPFAYNNLISKIQGTFSSVHFSLRGGKK